MGSIGHIYHSFIGSKLLGSAAQDGLIIRQRLYSFVVDVVPSSTHFAAKPRLALASRPSDQNAEDDLCSFCGRLQSLLQPAKT